MADQIQSDKNKQETGKPIQLDKDQRGGQEHQQEKKPMGGQEQRPGQHGAEQQGGVKQ
jgi:hypothetical protein